MFNAMKEGIREETVGFLFNLEVQVTTRRRRRTRSRTTCGPRTRSPTPSTPPRSTSTATTSMPTHPHVRAKGLQTAKAPENLTYTAPSEDGEVEIAWSDGDQRRRPLRRDQPQRPVPVWLGQEVQEVPRRPGWPDEPHRASRRLSRTRSAELEGGAAPAAVHLLDPRRDRAGTLTVAHVHADLGGLGRRAEHVHAAHLAAQPADAPVSWRGAREQRRPALQVGVDPARWSSAAAGSDRGPLRSPRRPRWRTGARRPPARRGHPGARVGREPGVDRTVLP